MSVRTRIQDESMQKLMVFSIYNKVIQILREKKYSFPMVVCSLGKAEKKSIETTINSLELLVKLHS